MQSTPSDESNLSSDHSNHESTFSVWPGWRVLLQDTGVNGANVLRRAKLPGDMFARDSVHLNSTTYYRLWDAIEEEVGNTGDPTALRFAQKMSADWFNPELFVALCSDDLTSALARLAKYKSGPVALKLAHHGDSTTAVLRFLDPTSPPPQVLMAFKLAFFVQLARLATRGPVHPLRVGWPSPALSPQDSQAYATWFGVSVENLPVPTVVFAQQDMQRPFLTANDGMWKFFEPALRQRLDDLENKANTTERVRSVLIEALPAGNVSMATVSKKLGISARTLQRRLYEEGSSFQQTLDRLRNALAHHYLQHSSLSGAEISFLLGFENPNSFVRAFQSWTGTTPNSVRLAHLPSHQAPS